MALPAFEAAQTLLVYISFGGEVETRRLIEAAFVKKKRVVVPVMEKGKGMLLSELTSLKDLTPGLYKEIHEPSPANHKIVDPAEIELTLVPGVVFDRKGGRIGMGGGHFDRYFPKAKNTLRVALAFNSQIHKQTLPLDAFDMRMHLIVTETGVIETGVPLPKTGQSGA